MGITTEEQNAKPQRRNRQENNLRQLAGTFLVMGMDDINRVLEGECVAAGGKMKETGEAHWKTPNTDTTAVVLQVFRGYRNDNGAFYDIGNYGTLEFYGERYHAWYRSCIE
jgi:hypothetical protein